MAEHSYPRWWWCAACRRHLVQDKEPLVCPHCGGSETMIQGRGAPRDLSEEAPWEGHAPQLFNGFDRRDLSHEEQEAVTSINRAYDVIDYYFRVTARFARRVPRGAGGQGPPSHLARELASCYALRTVELLDAASVLSEQSNAVALFPVMRALYETWFVCAFAHVNFSTFVREDTTPERWLSVGVRLLLGRSGSGHEWRYISPGEMRSALNKAFRRRHPLSKRDLQQLQAKVKRDYEELSDGTHPTPYSLMPYLAHDDDADGGVNWVRKPEHPVKSALYYLDVPIQLLRAELKGLLESADESDAIASLGYS